MNRRKLTGFWNRVVMGFAVIVPLAALIYVTQVLPEFGVLIYLEQFLALFLSLCLTITFLTLPFRNALADDPGVPWYDVVLALVSLAIGLYVFFNYASILSSLGVVTTEKVVIGALGILLLFEATRRQVGWSMVLVGAVALAYVYFGHYLSGPFEARVIRWERLATYNYFNSGAIFGTPLFVAASIVTSFIVFGQSLFMIGGGQAIADFSLALMGRRNGGPAKVAIVASALFGSLSGSASANVATTGIVTIPMMKRVGYNAERAAAVEAVASTGGLVLPPVMAATGFLMAEFLAIPYSQVAIAAALPALFIYLCLFCQVDMEARKFNLGIEDTAELPSLKKSLRGVGPVVIPFAILLYTLFVLNWNPAASAFSAAFSTVVLSVIFKRGLEGLNGVWEALAKAGEATVFVAVMSAIAGLVVGCLGLTGLGSSLSHLLVTIAGSNVLLLLLFAAIGCIIIGMGVPVTATYIILIILIGPAMVRVGVDALAAHMFVFYFGTLSFLTPPVCLAVFVAAGIAEARPMTTAVHALRYAVVAIIIPFAFIYNESYLLQGNLVDNLHAIFAGVCGILLMSAALVGYFRERLPLAMRAVALVLGPVTIFIGSENWYVAFAAFAVLALFYSRLWQRIGTGAPTLEHDASSN
jgi:TRAP transporter 4TM/12TM fusion protein